MRGALFITCMLAAAVASAQPALGRLFLTPLERAQLNGQRGTGPSLAPPPPAPVPPPPPPVTFDGVVKRSIGASTYWLNAEPQADAGTRITRQGKSPALTVYLPNGTRATLKPGQTVDPAQHVVREANGQ